VFVPEYSKPEAPGLAMNFDNTVSLYHVVEPDHAFERAAQDVVALLREAQARFPDWPRTFYVDILGHLDERGRFTPPFVEFQQEFFFAVVAPFVSAFELPLTGGLVNPDPQRNDVPDRLRIGEGEGD
jgi:hypothetical protein